MPSDTTYQREPTAQEVGVRTEPKACGDCTVCCTVLGIGPNGKAPGVTCSYARPGQGCGVHPTRPDNCRAYQCIWTWADPLDITWRPDVAGFLLNPRPDPREVEVVVDPGNPNGWRREPYFAQLRQWSDPASPSIARVLVRHQGRVMVLFPDAEIDLGPPNDPHFQVQSGYETRDGRSAPFARFATRFGAAPELAMIRRPS
jgi:hypothetical protein